jgi:hypothetical protein
MKSYTELRNLLGTLSNNASSANLTLGDELMNGVYRRICRKRDWVWLQGSDTVSTTAATQTYALPGICGKLKMLTVTVGSTVYTPREITNLDEWTRLNTTSSSGDAAEYFYVSGSNVALYPIPATSSNTITVYYRKKVANLVKADYSTGNVSALTTQTAAVTGAGTTWTAPMVGRWIRITETDTAGSSGDHQWYRISAVGGATSLTLATAYEGATISGNTAYVIGEMPLLPDGFHEILIYGALREYFASVQPEQSQHNNYLMLYNEMFQELMEDNTNSFGVVPELDSSPMMENPNLNIRL